MRSTSQRSCWQPALARANAREQVLQAILSVGQALATPSKQIRAISHEESEKKYNINNIILIFGQKTGRKPEKSGRIG